MDPIPIRLRTPGPARSGTYGDAPYLLSGCCLEAERAARVSAGLQGLRNALPDNYHPHLDGLISEVSKTSCLLRDLADKSQVHMSSVSLVLGHLNVILPCLARTLEDIVAHYEDKKRTKENRWRQMYHSMSNELPGTALIPRFVMYNQYLTHLQLLLTRDQNFDFNAVESLTARILQFREARNIPPPDPQGMELVKHSLAVDFWTQETHTHWAEAIFTKPLPSRRVFKKQSRSFNNDNLSVTIFLQNRDNIPFLMIRSNQADRTWITVHGAHELRIARTHQSELSLTRWSQSEDRRKTWASLSFLTWEEMVLFYCTFVALKVRSPHTLNVHPGEFELRREEQLFQAHIRDAGNHHQLKVYQDMITKGIRLHAMIRDGKYQSYPVWTAFIPPEMKSSSMIRKSRRRVWIRDIQVYTFSDKYRAQMQMRGKFSAFELEFVHSEGASRFKEVFFPPPPPEPTVVTDPSDNATDDQDAVSESDGTS
ncbi:hypothetical protein F4778DRAFT_786568 [Xylariomycetidae sp. FL2044]|nr:hypothetical protein F4778DRAFT_786568 [Xylariomycetidae sp. FL2044]